MWLKVSGGCKNVIASTFAYMQIRQLYIWKSFIIHTEYMTITNTKLRYYLIFFLVMVLINLNDFYFLFNRKKNDIEFAANVLNSTLERFSNWIVIVSCRWRHTCARIYKFILYDICRIILFQKMTFSSREEKRLKKVKLIVF